MQGCPTFLGAELEGLLEQLTGDEASFLRTSQPAAAAQRPLHHRPQAAAADPAAFGHASAPSLALQTAMRVVSAAGQNNMHAHHAHGTNPAPFARRPQDPSPAQHAQHMPSFQGHLRHASRSPQPSASAVVAPNPPPTPQLSDTYTFTPPPVYMDNSIASMHADRPFTPADPNCVLPCAPPPGQRRSLADTYDACRRAGMHEPMIIRTDDIRTDSAADPRRGGFLLSPPASPTRPGSPGLPPAAGAFSYYVPLSLQPRSARARATARMARSEQLNRFRLKKRSMRAAKSVVRYKGRKQYADSRPRVNGRFICKADRSGGGAA